MIPADHQRRFNLAGGHQIVKELAHTAPLAISQPADARGQSLKRHLLLRSADPPVQRQIFRVGLEQGRVGRQNILRIPAERNPTERSLAQTEQRPNEFRHKAGYVERPRHPIGQRFAAKVVAVIEHDGAAGLELQHSLNMANDGLPRHVFISLRISIPQTQRLLIHNAVRHITVENIVRRGLIRHHIGKNAAADDLGQHVRGVAQQADRERSLLRFCFLHQIHGFIQLGAQPIKITGLQPAFDAMTIHLDAQTHRAVHGRCQRLSAAHTAQTSGENKPAVRRAVEIFFRTGGKGLKSALQNPLAADINPTARGHLTVHGQAQRLEPAEFIPGRPSGHQQRVGDQNPRRIFMRSEYRHRFAGLNQQRLIILKPFQRIDDRMITLPVPRRFAGAAVDDELMRTLGDLRIQVVHQHAQSRLLHPALAAQSAAAWSTNYFIHHVSPADSPLLITYTIFYYKSIFFFSRRAEPPASAQRPRQDRMFRSASG
ncbi:MAG: hypothetical protein BWY83_00375 [bacterium ADurb.Bin478]|nr:MAG: hypothetical protein BWY83_00375 [bacterium ADurb.Bin478]